MANDDVPTASLQESVLTLLCFFDEKGGLVSGLLSPDLFEEPYRDIAARAIAYHQRWHRAPGKEHIDDLFDHVLDDPKHRSFKTYKNVLLTLLEQSEGLNGEFVVGKITEFVKRQQIKSAIHRAGQRYQTGGEGVVDDVEKILHDVLRNRIEGLDAGTFLNDRERALSFLDDIGDWFYTGITELDRMKVGPTRKELLLLIAGRGKGKTWGLQHFAKMGMRQRLKVAHVTLEMGERKIVQRYFQSLFAIAKRDEEFDQSILELDELGRLMGIDSKVIRPQMDLNDPNIRRFLDNRMSELGLRLGGLVVKQFPSGKLTVPRLVTWLDQLDTVYRFIPDILLVDYPDLFYLTPGHERESVGRVVVDLRGVAIERNTAVVTASQSNREGEKANKVRGTHTAEDISKIATADVAITYSQTDEEYKLGLARLFMEKVRDDEGKFTILITQAYRIGQWVLESVRMNDSTRYREQIQKIIGELDQDFSED